MSAGEGNGYYGCVQAFRMDIVKNRLMKKVFFVSLLFVVRIGKYRNHTFM